MEATVTSLGLYRDNGKENEYIVAIMTASEPFSVGPASLNP